MAVTVIHLTNSIDQDLLVNWEFETYLRVEDGMLFGEFSGDLKLHTLKFDSYH